MRYCLTHFHKEGVAGIIVPMPAASVPNVSVQTNSHTAPASPTAGAANFEQQDDLFVLE